MGKVYVLAGILTVVLAAVFVFAIGSGLIAKFFQKMFGKRENESSQQDRGNTGRDIDGRHWS